MKGRPQSLYRDILRYANRKLQRIYQDVQKGVDSEYSNRCKDGAGLRELKLA